MRPLECAILRTLLYADVFCYAMSVEEIHFYLLHDSPVALTQIKQTIANSTALQSLLCIERDYITLRGQDASIQRRRERETTAQAMWPHAERYGRWLAQIPFVRMVALTGALAMHNPAGDDDDYDYFLITKPGRVWLARAFAVLLVRVVRLRGHEICPNYVLASDHLAQDRQDVYMAHEMVQMYPLYGDKLHAQMREQNAWTQDYLPNAINKAHAIRQQEGWLKRLGEWVLGGAVGNRLEGWEKRRKQRKFARQVQPPGSQADATLDDSRVKGHFVDHGQPILNAYAQRLRAYGLDDVALPAAGD
jgi:hypothetical protein